MFGLVLNLIMSGDLPALDFTSTAPDVRSPYSADGMPLMTSMDSMLSVESDLTSMPRAGVPERLSSPELPLTTGLSVWRLALLDIGAPSTMTAVPRLFITDAELAVSPGTIGRAVRMVMDCELDRSGFVIATPGSNAMASANELVCMWSIACLEMLEAVLLPALLPVATTTTSLNLKDVSFSAILNFTISPVLAVNVVSFCSMP